jgi:ribonuclease P protein component
MVIKAKFLNAKVSKAIKTAVSFSVSKKVARLAVQRNKLKRMGRLAIRRHADKIKDVSVLFYFTAIPLNQTEVDSDISFIVQNIK